MKKIFPSLLFLFFIPFCFSQTVELELFQSGFSGPVNLQHAGDDRLFVVEQDGIIKIMEADGTVNPTPFLNISSLVSNGSEQGLLGLAFHPDYANNGFFYVNYTNTGGDTQISRFSVDAGNPDIANPASELFILFYDQPFSNHNGGSVVFGPDGYLYISSGDGGSGGDPGNRAQNLTLLLGKILRIDIDNVEGGNNYAIPPDNPFATSTVNRKEIWAYGMRNPWKISFDSANGDLWIGDVGQENIEEIDRAGLTEAGLNYGWRCYEGSDPFNTAGCPPIGDLTFPIAEYSSAAGSGNCSITGGFVYRGDLYADLQGLYFFGDVCSGMIGTVDSSGNLVDHGNYSGSWVSFGEDVNKQLYILDIGGSIYKIVGDELSSPDFNSNNNLVMIPNPATEKISFELSFGQISQIVISDIKGSIVISDLNIATSQKEINVENLSPGIYLARVSTANGNTLIKKLIIE